MPLTSSARQIYLSKRTRRASGRRFRVGPIPDILMPPPGGSIVACEGSAIKVLLFEPLTLPVARQFDFLLRLNFAHVPGALARSLLGRSGAT